MAFGMGRGPIFLTVLDSVSFSQAQDTSILELYDTRE
jgi:hypothetical protein